MSTVERSAGVAIGFPGLLCGSGYKGATEDLDAAVVEAAEALRNAYGLDVTVRFNSDRESGGAWLVTHAVDRVGANAEIGVWASVVTEQTHARYQRAVERWGWTEDETPAPAPVGTLYVGAHLSEAASDCGYIHTATGSVADALAFVLAHGSLGHLT